MPVISIIVPIYKVEAYLRECLDSVIGQTFTDYECILVDDGSPDSCPAICDEYAAKNGRFRVIHKANGGLSNARNAGIRAACGEWIVLLDSDDLFADNEALANLHDMIKSTNAPVIFHNNLTISVDGADDYSFYKGIGRDIDTIAPVSFYKEMIRNKKVSLAAWLFSVERIFMLEHQLFFKHGIMHEDEHWMPRAICAAEKLAINHFPFYIYRRGREGSIMSRITPKHLFDKFLIIEELLVLSQLKKEKGSDVIYKISCSNLWTSIFTSLPAIEKEYIDDYERVAGTLKEYSYLLLYRKRIKNIVLYLFVSLCNIKMCQYIFKQYAQVRLFVAIR